MRKITEILRLKFGVGLSMRAVAQSLKIGYGTVANYIKRTEEAGLNWPLPPDIDERSLGRLLFPSTGATAHSGFIDLDYLSIYQELKSPIVTKLLLWQEYRECNPDNGFSYAQFCHRYRVWQGTQKLSMRQQHKAGEQLFIDYCGPTIPVVNPDTGDTRDAQLIVAALGASSYTYAEATWSQNQADFINAHVRALEFFGGSPKILVPDNLKAAVLKTHRYEPVKWSNTDRHQVKSNNTQIEVQNEQASQKEIFKAVQAGCGKVGYRTAISDRRGSSQSGHKRQIEVLSMSSGKLTIPREEGVICAFAHPSRSCYTSEFNEADKTRAGPTPGVTVISRPTT